MTTTEEATAIEGTELNGASTPLAELEPDQEAGPSDAGEKQGIAGFLSIREPAAKSLIPFNEVFRVPLDSFYASLYLSAGVDDTTVQSRPRAPRKLDLRVKPWYRRYKEVLEELELADKDVTRTNARLDQAEQNMDDATEEEGYDKWRTELGVRGTAYREAVELLYTKRDEQQMILREVRTSGYEIAEENVDPIIQAMGYTFQITIGAPELSEYEPMVIGPDMDLRDDGVWSGSEGLEGLEPSLRQHVAGRLSDGDQERYEAEAASLTSFAANENLVQQRDQLLRAIDLQQSRIGRLQQDIASLESQLESWKADRATLEAHTSYFYRPETTNLGVVRLVDINKSIEECTRQINLLTEAIAVRKTGLREIAQRIQAYRQKLQDLEEYGLARERRRFVEYWNDPDNVAAVMKATPVFPDKDPLADLLISLKEGAVGEAADIKTHFFELTSNGFYTRDGLSLADVVHLSETAREHESVVAICPTFDREGRTSGEVLTAVVNPRRSTKAPRLPVIKFVETYVIEIAWKGYGLGELSHSFNLFPGETKELVVEKQTKLATKVSEAVSREEATARKLTSSFEDNVEETFSVAEKAALSREAKRSEATSMESRVESEFGVEASASGKFGKFQASASVDYRKKKNDARTMSAGMESQTASSQSKDVLKKNVANAVKKTASDTSSNNKLEVSSATSEEREEAVSEKEVIRVDNPNIGRTVNYNFFQLQNLYQTSVRLTDVKIVIDTGIEVIERSGVPDIRVYELEEFNKLFADAGDDERYALPAAILAQQVMQNYAAFLPGLTTGNGALGVREAEALNPEVFQILNFSYSGSDGASPEESVDGSGDDMVALLVKALAYLEEVRFVFNEKEFIEASIVPVNAAAYYLEANVGIRPATEEYLEDRRDVETARQRALVEHQRAQTGAGVFFPDLPEGVTSLTMAGDGLAQGSVAPAPEEAAPTTEEAAAEEVTAEETVKRGT